jgi:hypothetical protein
MNILIFKICTGLIFSNLKLDSYKANKGFLHTNIGEYIPCLLTKTQASNQVNFEVLWVL